MPKRATAFRLVLAPRPAGMPAYRWLYEALRGEILDGRLRPGARLPGTRDLCREYGLSRGTIVNAFEQLKSEGYVEGSVGSGTYVSKVMPDDLLEIKRQTGPQRQGRPRDRHISDYARRVRSFPGLEVRPTRAFRANIGALELFPTQLWARIAGPRILNASTGLLLGCPPMGYQPLREAVSAYLGTSRGVQCFPEQVAIVSGVQEALDLTARLFLNVGDRVYMEDPGFTGASVIFDAIGARIVSAGIDDEGIKLRDSALRGVRMIYVTPGHQFPLGITMSLRRRFELLDRAAKLNALVFEDDYDSEFRYSGRPIPALQGLDHDGIVLYAGSFSKLLFSSLRLGYLVVPPDLVDRVAAAKSITARHAPLLEQAVLCDFITQGHFSRHLRRMREVYAERLSILLESAGQRLVGLLDISNIQAGLQTVGWLGAGLDEKCAVEAAAKRAVEVTPIGDYCRRLKPRPGLQLGFAAHHPREIRRGVDNLAIALEGLARRAL